MNLQEAQQFVGQFIKGDYAPGERAAFLEWLKGATEGELTVIADMHESMQGEWVLSEGPSAMWMEALEQKLDEGVKEEGVTGDEILAPVVTMVPDKMIGRKAGMIKWNAWMSAAAVAIVTTGTFLYVHQSGSKSASRAEREKLLSMSIVNPRGRAQKAIVLADGSKVWLNAGSELKYPPKFAGSERLVELSGEAFFEVSSSADRPFRVLIKDAEMDVLGTFFTIMAYNNEPASRTTLVEGSVKVISGEQSAVLKPGEQAEVTYSSPGVEPGIAVVKPGIDPRFVMAWKDGLYRFEGIELRTIMRELERAYDVTVQYQPNVGNPPLNGSINININKSLDAALKQLETATASKSIHFSRDGKIIIVSPT